MLTIKKVQTAESIEIVEKLSIEIWNEHYVAIIGQEQVDYMLEKFQSVAAMNQQIQEGLNYYLFYFNEEPAGYLGFKFEEEHLFLSKIYVLAKFRGNKIGKAGLDFVTIEAKNNEKKGIRLTVNKYNTNSIEAYKKMGFVQIDEVVADIGKGYVMDDYILLKSL
ncbi:GNAT family N-acetyltransferase [Flammeovirga sp. EKP202]|uniref:GNAT family N-acetyltransferase n=1 Tax=Flammeovirga sp. EKP202 TaxID=2770592 RepID=UPI00165ECC63|nr:GNAT family N-acetyltransferase [Flammeovirga sp. EKP202]MBD0403413.1 GNAT family N-acetyltransferase [Flammeovirga sp. EKP202]